jgi:tetratricopeptide (TPR) repeat protein
LLGLAYVLRGHIAEALPVLEKSEAEAPAVRIFDTSTVRTALGTGYLLAGRLREAGEAAARAAEEAVRHGFRGTEAWAAHLLGEIAAQRDAPDVAGAEDQYRRGLALAEQLGMRPLVAHCHLGLGRLNRDLGKRSQAKEHLATALSIYSTLGLEFWSEMAKNELTACA